MANWQSAGGRPEGRRNATTADKEQFFHLVETDGLTPEDAAEALGFARATGCQWMKYKDRPRPGGDRSGGASVYSTPPKKYRDLATKYKACLEPTPKGFNLFRREFLNTFEVAWQTAAAAMVIEAELQAQRQSSTAPVRLLANVFPGGGKSKTFTHDYVVWRIVRARARGEDIRIQLGARTLTQSGMYTMRVRATLTTNIAIVGAFGRFKPQHPELWEKEQFKIEHLPGVRHDEKEPTVFAVSQLSGFLGARGHICIWDDLVDKSNNKTAESREALRHWWSDEASSRVEPRGVLALVGTRTNANDLFKTCAGQGVETGEADGQGRPVRRRLYRHFTFPVHAADRCTGGSSRRSADHVGCLNYPERYSWDAITDLMAALGGRFRLTYQQEDADPDVQLVQQCWLDGTEDAQGLLYPGCYDWDRGLWEELPPFALERHVGLICVDPSPTQWWAVEAWVYDRRNDLDYLFGMERRKMTASALLDLRPGTFEYSGVLEEFVTRMRKAKIQVRVASIEANAAQKFITQYAFFKDWLRSRSLVVRPHQTHGPGLMDDKYGIHMLGPRYMHGKIRLPMKGPGTRRLVNYLTQEALAYPEGDTDDCLKAQWFGHANRDRLGLGMAGPDYYSKAADLSPHLAATRRNGSWDESGAGLA